MKRRTTEDYCALAKEKSLVWVGESLPKDTHTKTGWKCLLCQDEFYSKYVYVLYYGNGCSKCGIKRRVKARTKKNDDYVAIAKSKNLEWIGQETPKNTKTKTLWRCLSCNYEWKTHYNNVYNSVVSCPSCAGEYQTSQLRRNETDYHNIADKMNLEWIGVLPINNKGKTLWRCKKCDFEWMGRYNDIQQGYGCQSCANMVNGKPVSIPQLKLADLIGGTVNYQVGNMWVDVAFPDRKIAIEYDSWYWHAGKQEQDRQRAIDLIDLGWKVLVVKANLKVPSKKKVKQTIMTLSPDIPYAEIVMSDWMKGKTAKEILGL